MRKLFFCLTAAVAVAGCTSESDRPISDATGPQAQPAKAALATAIDRATGRSSVASLPDRGALLAFDAVNAPSREGATTLYPIRMSEAHALNAASPGGTIDVATPAGETMRFAYASHSEDALGNWTWVGNTADGLSAVITFGKDAVFGQIALPGAAPLQLTTRNGRTWLGVIDSTRALSAHLLRKGKPDVLIPRIAAAGAAIAAGGKAAPAQPGFAVKASPANTVDLALGFTPGMITTYGSVSGVNTRLANLVAVANAAYQRSQVTPRVRLVHTMQVNYTDTNSNETALNALTGFVCNPSCTPTTVPAELQPLRTARDQFGADLVSLVRPLRAPQNEGCGIAWLLGGGGEGDTEGNDIDNTDAPYGYSVISDGQDLDETDGNNYLCYVETLAHELGHNMGQAHNIQDSGNRPGRHSYSYGYRETSTTGFFTIMAYPLANSSQFPISYFANPNVNDSGTGRVTGTAAADNARSLNQTMPRVAQFRAAVVPFPGGARNDFNGDGKSDIGLWNSAISYFAYWIMNGSLYTGSAGFGVASGSAPAASGTLGSNANKSLMVRNAATQALGGYVWNGNAFAFGNIGQAPGASWEVAGLGDVDGDGKDDIFWRNTGNGQFAVWLMNGLVFRSGLNYGPPVTYVIAGIGDFNADGRADVLWNDPGSRIASIWFSTGTGFTVSQIGQYGSDWNMVGVADVTGDGKSDILLRDNARIYLAYWRMDGAVFQGAAAYGLAADQRVLTTGDYDGDGLGDVLITRDSDRRLLLWRSNGTSFTQSVVGNYGAGWSVIK